MLVFIFTFSGWVEAFPMWTEKVQEVARCLLKEIIPQFGIPVSVGSDNGPAFVGKVVQLVARSLGITWKLHIAYCPQSSGKVEHITVGKAVLGDPFAMGSITTHSITEN
jgi:transposase InsO family protein